MSESEGEGPDLSEAQEDELTREMLVESCAFFAAEFLSGPPDPPYNGRFVAAMHHLEWDELLENDRLCVLAPRNHGKTYFFSFAVPIWQAYNNPNKEGMIFSGTQRQAERILEDIKAEIESNPKLQHLNPKNKRRNWTSKRITLANGHTIRAAGYGAKTRGAHPDWIVVDDGLNDEDAVSELTRTKNIDYFLMAITPMINPGGQIIVVGTPFHAADLYATLASTPTYCFRKYAAIRPDGTALWPERFCRFEKDRLRMERDKGIKALSLENVEKEQGPVRFAREYLCEPISDAMSLFPERLFEAGETKQYHYSMGRSREYYVEKLGIVGFYCGFDFAISSSTSADFTVGFVLGVDRKGNRWVIDIQRHKGLEYAQQKDLIRGLGRKYDVDLIYLESNQMQRIFGDDLIRETSLPIYKFVTSGTKKNNKKQPTGNTHTMNKNSLEGGVPQLRVLLENGKVRIPVLGEDSEAKATVWIKEMRAFTWLDGKLQGVGQHDDTVMAFWIACCAARAGDVSVGDEDDDFDDGPIDIDALYGDDADDALRPGEDPVGELLNSWKNPDDSTVNFERMFGTAGSTDALLDMYEDAERPDDEEGAI